MAETPQDKTFHEQLEHESHGDPQLRELLITQRNWEFLIESHGGLYNFEEADQEAFRAHEQAVMARQQELGIIPPAQE